MSLETIVVEKNAKFGPVVKGEYYSFGKFFQGNKELPVGVPLAVDIFTSDSGKKYINSVTKPILSAAVIPVTPVATDWVAKDRSQLVGGRSHDAVELVNVSLTTQTAMKDVLELYKEALQGVLKIADEVK